MTETPDLLGDILAAFPDLAGTGLGAHLEGEAVGVETSLTWLGDQIAEWMTDDEAITARQHLSSTQRTDDNIEVSPESPAASSTPHT